MNKDKRLSEIIEKPVDKNKIRINISKSEYKLSIINKGKTIKDYMIVLGRDPVNDKLREGDRRTPEGDFRVQDLYPHPSWSKFIWINYPTKQSWTKHERAKAKGEIDTGCGIGGEIGIHGVPSGDDGLVEQGVNWTQGCISLKTEDINEIFEVVQVGTIVTIGH
jgi:murein L,D-transpeptidase YafK